jgi:hypothetical protein
VSRSVSIAAISSRWVTMRISSVLGVGFLAMPSTIPEGATNGTNR